MWPRLPSGLHRPEGRLADPNFFPGGSGYLRGRCWSEIQQSLPPKFRRTKDSASRPFLIVGHFQANLNSYAEERKTPGSQFRRTWTRLASLLAGTEPNDFFLTNARLGLPGGSSTTGFRSTSEHDRRCAQVLVDVVNVVKPTAILCLGPHAARILAIGHAGLEPWHEWNGFSLLDNRNERMLSLRDGTTSAAVVRHPSAIPSSDEWARDRHLVSTLFGVGSASYAGLE